MFLFYEHVPYTPEYITEHHIYSDLSDSYLSLSCKNLYALDNVIQDKIVFCNLKKLLIQLKVCDQDAEYIMNNIDMQDCPLTFNISQNKYQIFFIFSSEEKQILCKTLQNKLWSMRFISEIDDHGTSNFVYYKMQKQNLNFDNSKSELDNSIKFWAFKCWFTEKDLTEIKE